jgi:DNA-binding transcriptional MerR regulator
MPGRLTHKDLARDLGVSETTIKSYRRKFPEFILVASRGKPLRFEEQAMEVCRLIRACFSEGMSVEETRSRLAERFPSLAEQERGASESTPAGAQAGLGAQEFSELLSAFREAASQGVLPEADAKLGRIEHSLEELISLQTRNAAQQAELLTRLDSLMEVMGKTPQLTQAETSRRVVVTRSREEEGGTRPRREKPEKPDRGEELPPEEFRNMPVVIRSGRGEFLGVTGPSGAPFSLREFERYLRDRAEAAGAQPSRAWRNEGEDWVLTLSGSEQEPGQTHVLTFTRTRTPRGNMVALLHRLAIEGREVSESFLQAFFKQIKDAVA